MTVIPNSEFQVDFICFIQISVFLTFVESPF